MGTAADTSDALAASFESARLRMRLPRRDDAQALLDQWVCDPLATRFMLFPTYTRGDVASAEAFLDGCVSNWESRSGHRPWVMIERADASDTPIGMIGASPGRGPHEWEVGYIIARAAWGKGYATEVVRAFVPMLLADARIWRVFATTHRDNLASQRVLAKAGFLREGTLRRYFVFPSFGSEPQTCTLWARTRDDALAPMPGGESA